jgi:hypothetical protein
VLEKSSFRGDLMFRDGTWFGRTRREGWKGLGGHKIGQIGDLSKERQNNYVDVVMETNTTMLSSVEYNF